MLVLALSVYVASTLVSQATMSIGAAVLVGTFAWLKFRASSVEAAGLGVELRYYRNASLGLAAAWVLSLLGLYFTPFVTPGYTPPVVHWFSDLAKLWYFGFAPVLALAIGRLERQQERAVWKSWLWTFLILSVVGVIQFYTGWPRRQVVPNFGESQRFHATLFLGHHLSVSSIWIFPFFVSFAGCFSKSLRERFGLSRRFFISATVLGCATLLLTQSRMLWLALPVGLLVFGICYSLRIRNRWPVSGMVAGALVVSLLFLGIPEMRKRLFDSMGTHERIELWKANWEFFLARPLTGVGRGHNLEIAGQYLQHRNPGKVVFVGHAHNNFLDVLGSMGILGVAAWLLFNAWILRTLIRILLDKVRPDWQASLAAAWLAAFVVLHLNGLTNLNFWEGKVMHQLFLMIAWILHLSVTCQNETGPT